MFIRPGVGQPQDSDAGMSGSMLDGPPATTIPRAAGDDTSSLVGESEDFGGVGQRTPMIRGIAAVSALQNSLNEMMALIPGCVPPEVMMGLEQVITTFIPTLEQMTQSGGIQGMTGLLSAAGGGMGGGMGAGGMEGGGGGGMPPPPGLMGIMGAGGGGGGGMSGMPGEEMGGGGGGGMPPGMPPPGPPSSPVPRRRM